MRYEQLKTGDIFADLFGTYIKTNFGAAGIGGRMFSREKFIKERNEALFSLDEKKIRRYCKKYDVTIPRNEEVFWRTIYKSVCNVEGAPQEVKERAMAWLKKHGTTPKMG